MAQEKRRIPLIDILRGIAILCMVLVHLFYDLALFGMLDVGVGDPFWKAITSLGGFFVLISGLSAALGSNSLRRGLIVLGCGLIITAVTMLMGDGVEIYFGILHLLGLCMILYHLLRPLLRKIPLLPGLALWLCLFVFWLILFFSKTWPFEGFFWLGLPSQYFYSADYYPLLPWFFLFLLGSTIGELINKKSLPERLYKFDIKFLSYIGRHTLQIYMLHQPVILGLLWALLKLNLLH